MTEKPWFRRTLRWGQTNLVEIDPARYDAGFWRDRWRRTRIQGVIVNAGGIVAYYPSAFPLHRRAKSLGERDLYGEIVAAAREEGLSVIARMDSNRVAREFFQAYPDWICRDSDGNPYMAGDKYITCIGSPYYGEYLPSVMEEIIRQSRPDGFADNSWAGLPRDKICYCSYCQAQFSEKSGRQLPHAHDWDDIGYREWIVWNFSRRVELWSANNQVTSAAGGEDCLWLGMIDGTIPYNSERFIDLAAILKRTPLVMLDHQRRSPIDGFEQNTEAGKRLHGLLGWDKLIPESTPQYQIGDPIFRLASMPASEVRLWATSGFAGGLQPWWHHIGSCHEDRRQYDTAEPLFRWHEENQDVLVDRVPEADVGVVWSQQNHDFHGRQAPEEIVMSPYRGVLKALDRFAIPYLPLHADAIADVAERFKVIILPNVGALSDRQIEALKRFAASGGSVVATGMTSIRDLSGNTRPRPALAELFGLEFTGRSFGGTGMPKADWDTHDRHTYLRLVPETGASLRGPTDTSAAEPELQRHPLLDGFERTDTLPFGGFLPEARIVAQDTAAIASFVPDFPIYPPEMAWMRTPRTDIPAITVRERGKAKLIWLLADLDRCFARDDQLEHARIFANIIAFASGGHRITVSGARGVVTVDCYRQGDRSVIHLNNRLALSQVSGRQYDIIPIGPIKLEINPPPGCSVPTSASLRVAAREVDVSRGEDGRACLTLPQVVDHEVIAINWSRRQSEAAFNGA